MTIKEFFESKENLAIHCNTEEKVKRLLNAFDKAGYCWRNGDGYKEYTPWYEYKKNTCCSNRRRCSDIKWYKNNGYRIIEFEEIEFEDTSESKGNEQMIASHYEVEAYDCNDNKLATVRAFSFAEAYDDIGDLREMLNERVVKFVLKIPDEDIEKIKKGEDKK